MYNTVLRIMLELCFVDAETVRSKMLQQWLMSTVAYRWPCLPVALCLQCQWLLLRKIRSAVLALPLPRLESLHTPVWRITE